MLALLLAGPVVSAAPTRDQAAAAAPDASLAAPGPAARPLAELLRPDGTLALAGHLRAFFGAETIVGLVTAERPAVGLGWSPLMRVGAHDAAPPHAWDDWRNV